MNARFRRRRCVLSPKCLPLLAPSAAPARPRRTRRRSAAAVLPGKGVGPGAFPYSQAQARRGHAGEDAHEGSEDVGSRGVVNARVEVRGERAQPRQAQAREGGPELLGARHAHGAGHGHVRPVRRRLARAGGGVLVVVRVVLVVVGGRLGLADSDLAGAREVGVRQREPRLQDVAPVAARGEEGEVRDDRLPESEELEGRGGREEGLDDEGALLVRSDGRLLAADLAVHAADEGALVSVERGHGHGRGRGGGEDEATRRLSAAAAAAAGVAALASASAGGA